MASLLVGPVLALVLGWVLGASSQTPPSVTHTEVMKTQLEIIELLRAQRQAYLAANAKLPVSPRPAKSITQADPDFDFVLWEAEMAKALRELQDRMQLVDPSYEDSYASTLRLARSPEAPHNEAGLQEAFDRLYLAKKREYPSEQSEHDAWENAILPYLYRPMTDLLYQFGRPDRIDHYEGGTTWTYQRTSQAAGGPKVRWKLDCEFWGTTLVELKTVWNELD